MTKPYHRANWNVVLFIGLAFIGGLTIWNRPATAIPSVSDAPAALTPSSASGITVDKGADANARKALQMMNWAIRFMVESGPPFEAQLRQVSRVDDQEVRSIGRYIQSSQSRGLIRMDLQSKIGDQECRYEQTCDGRLVWTREQIGDSVRIRRVTIGRLDEVPSTTGVPTRLRVGGIAELLDSIVQDYDLKLVAGRLNETKKVLIVRGTLKRERLRKLLDENEQTVAPAQMPTSVRVAWMDEESEFRTLPVKIEFWGEATDPTKPYLPISVLDLYDIKRINPPAEEHFRYNTTEEDADFTDDTQYYLKRFQSRLTLNSSSLPAFR